MRRKPCVVLLLFLLDFSAPVDFCKVVQAAIEKCLFMRCGNVMALQIREIVFGVSHIPGAYTVLDHLFWVRLGALKNHDVLLRLCLVPLFIDYESTNFLKIVSLCNVCLRTNAFYLQPFAFVGTLIVL